MRKMRAISNARLPFFLAAGLLVASGCTPLADPEINKAREVLLVSSIDEPAISIEESIALIKAKQADSSEEVVVATPLVVKAKVGSGKGDTFEANSSAFLISDIPEGEHASDGSHDSDNCPFCRAREAKAPTVMVRLVGADGTTYKKPADELLGIAKGQHLVVKGVGTYDEELNFFTIDSSSIQLLK